MSVKGKRFVLYRGDCRAVIPRLRSESVDSIVCDPPYGIRFMGKDWDHGVPGKHFWETMLHVAKPGAYLLAFGGTRTFHRLAVAIEDAGWEIRDCIDWIFGSGFPKSHNVANSIDKKMGHGPRGHRVATASRHHPDGTFEPNGESLPAYKSRSSESERWEGFGTALKPAHEKILVARKPLIKHTELDIITVNLSKLEAQLWLLYVKIVGKSFKSNQAEYGGVFDIAQWNADDLINTQDALCEVMDMSVLASMVSMSLNIVSSWRSIWEEGLRHGRTFITETVTGQIIDLGILVSCLLEITPHFIIQELMSQNGLRRFVSIAAGTFDATIAKLSGTLQHFAVENAIDKGLILLPDAIDLERSSIPIIMARKPLIGTVAANVLEHGTGALNIDGCRVGVASDKEKSNRTGHIGKSSPVHVFGPNRMHAEPDGKGRWPANVIHDGSEEVVELFPVTKSGAMKHEVPAYDGESVTPLLRGRSGPSNQHGDSGSAARFFYTSKASKKDRGEGNTHATVKPTDLMRYLVRLVTQPNGVVLDPFMGSGSTGKAAVLEGMKFIGIEKEAEHVGIAEGRIRHAESEFLGEQ